jgi:hypothetical protein
MPLQDKNVVQNPEQMKGKITEGYPSKRPVKNPSPLHPSPKDDQNLCPEGMRIFEGKSSQSKADEGDHHHQVDETVKDIKSPKDFSFLYYHRLNPFLAIHEPS